MNTRFDPELSRLAFEDRLVEFCEDTRLPLLERVRLLGIVAGRLDVFFMTRVGRLKRLVSRGEAGRKSGGMTYTEQLEAVAIESDRITRRTYELLQENLLPALARLDVRIERLNLLREHDRALVRRSIGERLGTLISPLFIESTNAFPHVRNLRPALVAAAHTPGEPAGFVVVELPAELPRLIPLPGHRFVPVEQAIAAELPALCPGFELSDAHVFRVTRSADTDFGDADDVLGSVEEEVVRRPFQEVVRLEVESTIPLSICEHLWRSFARESDTPEASLGERDVFAVSGLVDLTALEEIAALDRPDLKAKPIVPRFSRGNPGLLEAGQRAEELLHFPFDDYEATLEWLLGEAAQHPDLESIQTTIYRTDRSSGVVAALREAKARGADAGAIVELKASFDERDNIDLARSLKADGIRVLVSPTALKVHAKIAVVTLRRGGARRHVALIGTGNMNAVTAKSYVDLWLLTSQPSCASEVAAVFDVLTGRVSSAEFDCLLVAPFDMRRRFLELIERETQHALAGREAGIRVMINGLSDPAIMEALRRASQAGVPIEMMVRGACLLRPRQPGESDNIHIVSVAGALLQHARIFHFRNAGNDAYFIGSADWRPRNLDGRVEVVTHIREADHVAELDRILTATLATDDAWVLGADGVYIRRVAQGSSPADQRSQTYVTLTPS